MSEERYGVLIGSSEFPESKTTLGSLPCVVEDISAMDQVLSAANFGGFTDVQSLLNLPSHEILLRINKVIHQADRDDLVFIYYSGHGLLDRSGSLHLATIDTDSRFLPSTAVASTSLRTLIRECQARRIVIVLDCCYSGAIGRIEPTASVERELTGMGGEITEGYAIFIMAASSAGQQVFSRRGDRNGPLTRHFLQAIRTGEADANRDGFITMRELFEYVSARMVSEGHPPPTCFRTGASGPLIVARNRNADDGVRLIDSIASRLSEAGRTTGVPRFVVGRMREILMKPVDEIRRHHASVLGLMRDWVRERLSTEEFVNQWYQLDKTGLPDSERASPIVSRELRWEKVLRCRRPILDYIGPTYVLDGTYHFLDWNPLFDELVAKPMGLVRGRHAEDFILKLQNQSEVIERSRKAFREDKAPLVDVEPLEFKSPKYGLIRFQKIAAQIPDDQGRAMAWSVTLNVLHVDQEREMWADLKARLAAEVNWANYAKSYDQVLLHFRPYSDLLGQIAGMIGDAGRVADLAAGTGNGAMRLVRSGPKRSIWAFESNEAMLEYFRDKLLHLPAAERDRVRIFKGDLLVSLREFEEMSFDAAMIINGLYALDDPARCMREVNRVLRPGGVVALSTPTRKTSIDRLFETIRSDLQQQGILAELRAAVDTAYDRHLAMTRNIGRDSRDDVLGYVKSAGLEVTDVIDDAYAGAVMIVRAVKPTVLSKPATNGRLRTGRGLVQAHSGAAGVATSERRVSNRVFICYAHEDGKWCDRLLTYMTPALRSGELEVWTDKDIRMGERWEERIGERLAASSASVLLVSQAFLSSEYIRDVELPHVLAREAEGMVVIPLILEKCMLDRAVFKFPDARSGPNETRLSSLQTAASIEAPMSMRDAGQQNMVLDQIAQRLIDDANATC